MTQWVVSLLMVWRESDRISARRRLGYPPVSGPWRALADDDDDGRTAGFTGIEVAAVADVMEWLRLAHHDEWRAVQAALTGAAPAAALLEAGLRRIGAKLDEVLG